MQVTGKLLDVMFSLASKTALVTGSGRGIGRSIAEQLTAAGARVMLNDLDAGPLEETRKAIRRFAALAGDVTDPAFPQKLVDRTIAEFGGLDIIVNNAGYTWDNIIQKTTDEQFQAMLDIHIVAPFRILRARRRRSSANGEDARRRKGGACQRKVVNITSISATDGERGAGGLCVGQGGRDRADADHGEGVGTVQRQRQRGRIRVDRDAADSSR